MELLSCGFGNNSNSSKNKKPFIRNKEFEDEEWKQTPCLRCQWDDEKIGKKIDQCNF